MVALATSCYMTFQTDQWALCRHNGHVLLLKWYMKWSWIGQVNLNRSGKVVNSLSNQKLNDKKFKDKKKYIEINYHLSKLSQFCKCEFWDTLMWITKNKQHKWDIQVWWSYDDIMEKSTINNKLDSHK